jgi:hypothetical protein
MDVVKERLQIEGQLKTTEAYSGSLNALKQIIRHEGIKGLYRAYWMHQLTWAPFNGLYFAVYESTKNYISGTEKPSWQARIIGGCLAGTVASLLTSPLDLVKTRLQVQRSNPTIFDYEASLNTTF